MGFISRRVIPACGNMCICCPALRPSSRQPVKRYKKLLGEIFPKSLDGPANERKIMKLCEYAARNPFRIPKIAKFLEKETYKELRAGHINDIRIITDVYSKLLCICKEQMVYFATSILNVINELLDHKRQDTLRVIGCRTLTTFIYSQADGIYAHNVEILVKKVCLLACAESEDSSNKHLRSASLECLASMVWFMSTFSHIFTDFDEIILATLHNYGREEELYADDISERNDLCNNWVEAIRSDAGVASGVCNEFGLRSTYIRPHPELKESSTMTREERETPKIWARICIKRIVEMAKEESSTMRRTLDPMLTFFDSKRLWDPQHGLASIVLSDIVHFLRDSEKAHVIVGPIIRHVDHKNVVHDLQVKSNIIQTTIRLIQQLGPQNTVLEMGVINDLCRQLRKTFQASFEIGGIQESNWNAQLQSSIEDCLLEISKWINDAKPLFDMMTITLEEMPAAGVDARATTGSLLILAYMIASFIDFPSVVVPESLFLQLLKAMMHPDVDVRVGVHRIFSVLLVRCAIPQRHEANYFHLEYLHESRRWESRSSAAFASAAALLEKLRREKDCRNTDKIQNYINDDNKERDIDEEWRHGKMHKSSPNFYKISCSIIDRNACSNYSAETEPRIAALNDDQITQLLSVFWIQANRSDNLPSNYEAIAHSFCLTLLSARIKNSDHQNAMRIFQIPLTIKNASLGSDSISPSCRRSMFMLSMVMLNFGGKSYNIPELCDIIKSAFTRVVDPFLSVVDGFHLCAGIKQEEQEYGSDIDQREATSYIDNLRKEFEEFDLQIVPLIAHSLSTLTGVEEDNLVRQLFESFTPEDGLLFGSNSVLDWYRDPEVAQSDEAFSMDEECSTTQSIDGDMVIESPAPAEMLHSFSKKSSASTLPQVIGVGQLLESALQVAGQVAGSTVSASPLPYGTLTDNCESLGMGTRRKLSSWLSSHDLITEKMASFSFIDKGPNHKASKEHEQQGFTAESWLSLRLPPASPFDNFLKAARY